MSKGFRPGDIRRVEAEFEEMMPEGYGVEIKLSRDRKHMTVVVMDPENPKVYIANAQFDHAEKPLKGANGLATQPPAAEVMRIAAEFAQIITAYPAAKAKQDAEQLFKADFVENKQAARDKEAKDIEEAEIAAQLLADEKAQRARDKLLAKADAEEAAALADEAAP